MQKHNARVSMPPRMGYFDKILSYFNVISQLIIFFCERIHFKYKSPRTSYASGPTGGNALDVFLIA